MAETLPFGDLRRRRADRAPAAAVPRRDAIRVGNAARVGELAAHVERARRHRQRGGDEVQRVGPGCAAVPEVVPAARAGGRRKRHERADDHGRECEDEEEAALAGRAEASTGTLTSFLAHGDDPVAISEATSPPSLVQLSASGPASEAARAVVAPPAMTVSLVRGWSSAAHWVPQRQHAFSWRAIGARHESHTRGKCRSRMAQDSLVRDVVGVSISTTFPSADSRFTASNGSIGGRPFCRWRGNPP